MTDPAPQAMSVAEYLRRERAGDVKHEYVGGFIYPLHAQAGGSGTHSRIAGRIQVALHAAAEARDCRLYQEGMQLHIPASNSFFYPDVMLACDHDPPSEFYETLPCLLVEVLSPSTAHNDRRDKYRAYTALPSLHTYLIVSQTERYVVAYERQADGGWAMRELRNQGEVDIPCLGLTLTLEQMYGRLVAADSE
ncbi:Uma2 family endonuclease [Deinococcus wulumuqiensis]|uniref:Putative restriction endonuclease domain-containing protein n=1 Tax=Deinococcus wulumuqiensis TaxID=980427 RepID=A0AAV4K4G1_9DEIO|nr:Uma2 family endonuclease [Deinococcus wulumuqiensis]QII21345.1 Uma2 family endonuclease [Deinococcus wulumuqiensis R12]GGI78518.1 hypothetical protein GCM10010914_10880 [Deinococcus wulumuqiensis]GGP30578.1 hypothetical protein GCM10008021_22290 [Deinococcus wulumuqiensis]